MSSFRLNQCIAALLLSILIAMFVGNFAELLYSPTNPKIRGYAVEVRGMAEDLNNTEVVQIDIAALMSKGVAEMGKKIAKKCVSCHSFDKNGPHKIGPNLFNVVGSKKASKSGYKYSDAMIKKGGIWSEEDLFSFLTKPKQYIPGTKMVFPGIKNPEQVADLIAFLKTQQ